MLNLLLEQVVLVQEEDLLADVRRQEMITGGKLRTIDVCLNHCEWHIESQIVIASCI